MLLNTAHGPINHRLQGQFSFIPEINSVRGVERCVQLQQQQIQSRQQQHARISSAAIQHSIALIKSAKGTTNQRCSHARQSAKTFPPPRNRRTLSCGGDAVVIMVAATGCCSCAPDTLFSGPMFSSGPRYVWHSVGARVSPLYIRQFAKVALFPDR